MSNEVVQKEKEVLNVQAFSSMAGFEVAQRMAKALAESDLVPTIYKGKIANCIVALELAQRCQASVLMVMQNLYLIQGKPSWSSQYIIASLNSCGKFSPLRFKMEDDNKKCTAYAIEHRTGETLEGPAVSIAMAKAEGWLDKSGSKWKTMPDLMLRYRAAAFFGRLYAPEVLMGLKTQDEVEDIIDSVTGEKTTATRSKIDSAKVVESEDLSAKLFSQLKTPPKGKAKAEEVVIEQPEGEQQDGADTGVQTE